MLVRLLRWLTVAAALGACASGTYLDDASVRRSSLEDSLVNKSNGYSVLRLAHYGKDWESLPVYNPTAIALEGRDLRAIGEDAFLHYPVQPAPAAEKVIDNPAWALAYGLHDVVRVGGTPALTCATCHSKDGAAGVPNSKLDLGALVADAGLVSGDRKASFLAWGPGRVDVTTMDGTEPVKIPDLRPVRFETHLHATASVVQRDVTSLAVRIETLIITANGMTVRPPREIPLGLATYLLSLADDLPTPGTHATFEANCARCHAPPNFSGPPVPIDVVGTDPRVGLSAERGTGNYRVPSLRGVGTRGPLLHDASMPSIETMFDPSRAGGHRFGLDLDDGARARLIAYLRTL
jgi:mono/diheme cytochrome c family protein